MTHFVRTNPDAVWNNGGAGNYLTIPSDWISLGQKAFKAINGDLGGAYAPTSLITFDSHGFKVTGPTIVDFNGMIQTTNGSAFSFGLNDYPLLAANHVGRTRTIRQNLGSYICTPRYHFTDCPTVAASIQSLACTIYSPTGLTGPVLENPAVILPIRVHDNGRLVSMTIEFIISAPRDTVPVRTPRMRVVRANTNGQLVSLRAPSSVVDSSGFFNMTAPVSGAAWYNDGQAQTFTFLCDQNNVIDTSKYTYYLQLFEEVGTLDVTFDVRNCDGTIVRERKIDSPRTGYSVPLGPSNLGGVTLYIVPNHGNTTGNPSIIDPAYAGIQDGQNVLVSLTPGQVSSANPFFGSMASGGMWICHYSGAWERVAGWKTGSDFTPWFLCYDATTQIFMEFVPTTIHPTVHETYYRNTSPGQDIGTTSPPAASASNVGVSGGWAYDSAIAFQRRLPRGNIYSSLTCTFDSIADMRPQ